MTPYFTYTIPSKWSKVLNLRARIIKLLEVNKIREFPGSPVVGTLSFSAGGMGLIPGWGTEVTQPRDVAKKRRRKQV